MTCQLLLFCSASSRMFVGAPTPRRTASQNGEQILPRRHSLPRAALCLPFRRSRDARMGVARRPTAAENWPEAAAHVTQDGQAVARDELAAKEGHPAADRLGKSGARARAQHSCTSKAPTFSPAAYHLPTTLLHACSVPCMRPRVYVQTFLVSGPLGGGQRRVVQRPWPEYVPESSAAVGRSWDTFNLSSLHEARPVRLKKMGYTHSPRATPRELARLASYPR
jgi:hypothetical protein